MDQTSTTFVPRDPDFRDTSAGDEFIAPDIVSGKLDDALTPTYQAEFAPDEAEAAGAFLEDALSEDDAAASAHDSAYFTPHSPPPGS